MKTKICVKTRLTPCLLFADDAVLITTSTEEEQEFFNRFSLASKIFGLTIKNRKASISQDQLLNK